MAEASPIECAVRSPRSTIPLWKSQSRLPQGRFLVVLCFGLTRRHPIANLRHYHFMLAGLADTAERLERRGVGFVLRICADSNASFAAFCETIRPSLIIADEDPAGREPAWRRESELYRRVLRSGALMLM
jgi:hypothetical protein